MLFVGQRCGNVYRVTLEDFNNQDVKCFASFGNEKWLWPRRLGHASMYPIFKLIKRDIIRGVPKIKFDHDLVCDAYQNGKQSKSSFKPKDIVLQLDHLNFYILIYLV